MIKNTKSNMVASLLKDEIDHEVYEFGSCIPSERELAEKYNLNRATIRAAILSLVEEGYLTKVQGKGNFVTRNSKMATQINFKGMNEVLKKSGFEPSSKIIATDIRKAGYKLSQIFNIKEDEKVFRVMRLRIGNKQPISIEDTYVPYSLIPDFKDIDFQVFSLYDIFAAYNIQIENLNLMFTSTRARKNEARLLKLNDGDTVISVTMTGNTTKKKVVEYTEVLVINNFSDFYTDSYFQNGEVKLYAQIN